MWCVMCVKNSDEKSNRSLVKVNDPRLWLLLCNTSCVGGDKIWLAANNDSEEWFRRFACVDPCNFTVLSPRAFSATARENIRNSWRKLTFDNFLTCSTDVSVHTHVPDIGVRKMYVRSARRAGRASPVRQTSRQRHKKKKVSGVEHPLKRLLIFSFR